MSLFGGLPLYKLMMIILLFLPTLLMILFEIERIYVGSDAVLKHQIIDSLHNSPIGGHSGIVATYQRVKKRFDCLVETFLHECAVCH